MSSEWETTVGLIAKNKMKVFRRLYMKRRTQDGYESSWQKIDPKYILSYGSVTHSIDDIKPNFFNISGLTIRVRNNDGFFNDVDDSKSFWNGYLSRYKTLIKIEAGYEDENGTEYPSNPIQYIGIIDKDFSMNEQSIMEISTKNIVSVFENVPASQIAGLGATLTASEIVTKIKEHTDANEVKIFQQYISAGAWYIDTTTTYYNFATTTSLQGMSCWDLLKKLAEAENYIVYVSRDASFYWKERATYYENQTTTNYTDNTQTLWNKLGSDIEVQNSEAGPNGSWQGTSSYISIKFNNGMYINNDNNYIDFDGSFFTPNNFTIEVWFKTDYNVVNGQSQDGKQHCFFVWFYNNNNRCLAKFTHDTRYLEIDMCYNSSLYYFNCNNASITFSAGSIHHIAFVYDKNGIDGGADKLRIYFDGTQVFNSTSSPPTCTNSGGIFHLGVDWGTVNPIPWINFTGGIDNIKIFNCAKTDFSDKDTEDTYHLSSTTTYTYEFHGLNMPSSKFGHNIMKKLSIKQPISKVYNRVRVKFREEDTLTSYYIKEESWNWGDSSSSYKYGVSTYNIKNEWIPDTATAQTIADSIYNERKEVKEEVNIETKFIPIVDLLEKVTLGYKSQVKEGTLWGYFLWGYGIGTPRKGRHINYENKEFKIIKMVYNFDNFKSQFVLQEI